MDCIMPGFSSLFPWVCSNSRVLSQWCHPTISSSVTSSFFCPQSFPASGSFLISQLFALGGQIIGASALASVLPMNIQNWFPLRLTGLISLLSKDSQESSPAPQLESINSLTRQWHPTPVLLPGKSQEQRSLAGCSPRGCKESDMTEWLPFHFSLSCIGKGNGSPLQCSCLENPRDGGACWAALYGVTQSRTRLKWLSSSMPSLWTYTHIRTWLLERHSLDYVNLYHQSDVFAY